MERDSAEASVSSAHRTPGVQSQLGHLLGNYARCFVCLASEMNTILYLAQRVPMTIKQDNVYRAFSIIPGM